jgi:hypothetical protein
VPGIDISAVGQPVIKADGGPVFGGALVLRIYLKSNCHL